MDAKLGLAAILRDARKGALLRMRSVFFARSHAGDDVVGCGAFVPCDRFNFQTAMTVLRPSLRAQRSNPFFLCAARWIASRSLSSGAHSRDPLARNDGKRTFATSPRHAPEALINLTPRLDWP